MIKTKLRTIYVYTTNTYGQKGWTKVGQTSRDANQRISEQDGTSMPEPLIRVKNSNGNVLEFKTYLTDDEIRSELFKLGYHEVRQDKRREWVGGFENPFDNGDEIELAINKIIAKSEIDTRKKYEPYFYKKFIKNVFLRILDINLTLGKKIMEFALELAPRFGKTTWMIDLLITLFEKYGFKLAVLPSYWLSSLSSFEKELYSWKGFDEKIHFVKRGESVKDAIKTLSNKNISKADKEKKIKEIALEYIDINALGMYTLGDKRKTLDKDTLREYKILFEKYFLKSLTSRLKDYTEKKFEVISSDQKSETYTIVNSKIGKSPSQPEIKIDWRVYTKNVTKPLIRDLIVEGLSLAKTQKAEFASILSSNKDNINILLLKLQEFIDN